MIRRYAIVLLMVPILAFAKAPKRSPLEAALNPPNMMAGVPQNNWFSISYDWLHCGFDLISDSSFVANLPGSYNASIPLKWCLTTISAVKNVIPDVCQIGYVANQYGQPQAVAGIPVTWEISIDGGSFAPMTLDPPGSISATLPVGSHIFALRMTGHPFPFQASGHYHLELYQSFAQQL